MNELTHLRCTHCGATVERITVTVGHTIIHADTVAEWMEHHDIECQPFGYQPITHEQYENDVIQQAERVIEAL